MYKAKVNITLRPSIVDPQGKATYSALKNLGLHQVEGVRIGKYIEMNIATEDEHEAKRVAELACTKLLANEVMELFKVRIEPVG